MLKQITFWLALVSVLAKTTIAFPIHFPPPAFTNATMLLPDQIPTTASDPGALSSWTEETPLSSSANSPTSPASVSF